MRVYARSTAGCIFATSVWQTSVLIVNALKCAPDWKDWYSTCGLWLANVLIRCAVRSVSLHSKPRQGRWKALCVHIGREVTSESSAVLHYTFTRFSDLKARRDRCDCAPTEEDAKRCFILPFDRMVRAFRS